MIIHHRMNVQVTRNRCLDRAQEFQKLAAALSPEMREHYTRHLLNILPPAAQILLITLDYPQQEMADPPFAVFANEVEALYHQRFVIRLLSQMDVLAQEPRFQERGLSRLRESVFLLVPHK
jgi:thiopurine S-methyltransferase